MAAILGPAPRPPLRSSSRRFPGSQPATPSSVVPPRLESWPSGSLGSAAWSDASRPAGLVLDGTLVATDRFWPDAARAGALRAFEELGLEQHPPEPEVWMAMVGQPLEEAFVAAFPDLTEAQRQVLLERCVEEEHRLLDEGRAGLLPGVTATLQALRADGVRIGVASNCSGAYLEQMMRGLGLAEWVEEPRCLDSPGIRDKGDMVEDLLLTFGTRHAVMVGDRSSDRDAAWANGIPHVHLARGYALASEEVEAEGCISGMDALVPCWRSGPAASGHWLQPSRSHGARRESSSPARSPAVATWPRTWRLRWRLLAAGRWRCSMAPGGCGATPNQQRPASRRWRRSGAPWTCRLRTRRSERPSPRVRCVWLPAPSGCTPPSRRRLTASSGSPPRRA